MNRDATFSSIPVGQQFEYKGEIYTRFTYFRGKQIKNGKPIFTRFHKHQIVTWINVWANHLGE